VARYLRLDRDAVRIMSVSPLRVPGLCQTQEYAEAIARRAGVPEREISSRVAVKLGRQQALFRSTPAQFMGLIGECVLRQRIGGPAVMASQLRFLLELAERPNIDLRIVPDAVDSHPGLDGPCLIVETSDGRKAVHLENALSGLFLQQEKDVAAYETLVMEVLRVAMPADLSIERIAREAEEIAKGTISSDDI
jgi:hypothetical protein